MVICRYFLQPGGCRFGESCRFDHVADDSYADDGRYAAPGPRGGSRGGDSWRGSGSDFRTPRYPQNQQRFYGGRGGFESQGSRGGYAGYQQPSYRQPSPSYDSTQLFNSPSQQTSDSEILEDVSLDIKNLWAQTTNGVFQKGKVWPFSTYSYISADGTIRTDPLFGLADHSMEELRFAAYSARTDANAIQAHIQDVNKQGNVVRLMCTDICNAASMPHSEGAKKILAEIRSKAGQHQTSLQQGEISGAPSFAGYQSAAYSQPVTSMQPNSSSFHVQSLQQAHQIGPQAGPTVVEPRGVYSDTNMLSADDFLQFASPEFTYGKVPYRPPPQNLC